LLKFAPYIEHTNHEHSSGRAAAAFSPNFVVNRVQIWNVRSGEMNSVVSRFRRLIVSRTRRVLLENKTRQRSRSVAAEPGAHHGSIVVAASRDT